MTYLEPQAIYQLILDQMRRRITDDNRAVQDLELREAIVVTGESLVNTQLVAFSAITIAADILVRFAGSEQAALDHLNDREFAVLSADFDPEGSADD